MNFSSIISVIIRYITKNQWLIAIEIAILATFATFIVPGGGDLEIYYLPVAQGCVSCGYVPYFTYWFLWPLGFFPHHIAYFFLIAFSLFVFLTIIYVRRTNPLVILLSFPAMAQMWVGQIDAFVALGLALALGLYSKNHYWRGIGLVLAMIKPQLSLLPLIVMVWQAPKTLIKLLPIPIIAALVSFLQFGFDWPLVWLQQAQGLPTHEYRQTAQLLFPYSMGVLIIPFLLKDKDRQLQAAFIASAFLPQYSIYSYLIFMAFLKPTYWWMVPLSFIWLPLYPLLEDQAHIVQILFPFVMLLQTIWLDYRKIPVATLSSHKLA